MHPALRQHRDALIDLCHQFYVTRLEVFGSAATDRFDPDRSDVDLLVEFDIEGPLGGLEQFFGFKHAAETLLGRSVDIVNPRYIRNRYFRESVDATRVFLYAASIESQTQPRKNTPAGHRADG